MVLPDVAALRQRTIDRHLLDSGGWRPLTVGEQQAQLHPFEVCLLNASRDGRLASRASRALAEEACVARHANRTGEGYIASCGVGTAAVRPGHNTRRGACLHAPALPLHERRTLLSRFDSVPPPPRGYGSHLVRAMRRLVSSRLKLDVLGDSLARQATAAALCGLQRSLPSPKSAARAVKHIEHSVMGEAGWDQNVGGGGGSGGGRIDAAMGPVVEAARRRGGGVIMVVMGAHFNEPQRAAWRRAVRRAVSNLEAYAASCNRCVGILALTPTQHFPGGGGGGYSAAAFASQSSGTERAWHLNDTSLPWRVPYPCRPLERATAASSVASSAAHVLYAVDQGGGSGASSNAWRPSDARDAVRELKARHVILVPLDRVTRGAWDSHFGFGKFQGRGMDCTHFCNGPFLWEPLWWALAVANAPRTAVD